MVEQADDDSPSLEFVREVLRQRAPAEIEARNLIWSSYFRIHHRNVSTLRVGRVLLAGDSAHIHSPFGGQGMNTGLQDAWNLAWKLDFVLRGISNDDLLDSYNAERIPVIRDVIHTTDVMTKVMGTPNRFAQAIRNMLIPMVSRLAPFQHAFVQKLSELDITYHNSPIVEGPGNRYFDDCMRDGSFTRYLLVVPHAVAAAMNGALLELIDSCRDIVELRSSPHEGMTLVRPDGYAAYSTKTADSTELEIVRSLLHRQFNRAHGYRATAVTGSA